MRKNHVGGGLTFRMRAAARSLFVLVVVIAAASAATAYTMVFRDGHKTEVPQVFTLTAATNHVRSRARNQPDDAVGAD